MERIKINMNTEDYMFDTTENPVWEDGKYALEYLLSENGLCDCFFDTDEEAIEKCNSMLNKNVEMQIYLVGGAGTGKSNFLKTYFSLPADENFWVREDKLLLFFSGDGNGIVENQDIIGYFAEELKKVCGYYKQCYMDGRDIVCEDYAGFYWFVKETKKEALFNPWISKEEAPSAYEKEVSNLKVNKPFTYYMLKLKYYLLISKKISDVTVVCDNIRSKEMYEDITQKVKTCICNYNREKYSGYRVKTIFSMNEEVYWEIFDKNSSLGQVIWKSNSLNIQAFIEAKFNQAEMAGEEWMKERGFSMLALEYAKGMLDNLNSRFSGKYQKMILGLSMYNKEKVLDCYKKIVFNKTWVRKRRFSYDKDVFDENKDVLFNNITCIRALSCGDDRIYNPGQEGENLIPNILYNTEEEDYGLYILLLMKYFVRQHGIYLYREDTSEDVIKICERIWGNENEYKNFKIAIDYLRDMKVLKGFSVGIERRNVCGGKLRITEKGLELWDMLRSDSLLMELCREDCYHNMELDKKSSYLLLNTEKQYLIFEDLLSIVKGYGKEEDKLYQAAVDRGCNAEYVSAFGKKRMAFYLLEGVSKSISYSVSRSNEGLRKFRDEIYNEVVAAR